MAQLNTASFLSKWGTLFADNVTRDISEEDARDFRQDISDSFMNFLSDVLDEDDMASNSAIKLATQQSIKAYSDTKWPLGGAADLTAAVTIDGNGYDILIGDPNPINSFEVSVLDNFHFHSDDGTYHGHIQIANQDPFSHYLNLSFGDGSTTQAITLDNTVVSFAASSGVDVSSIILSPNNTILNLSDGGTFNVRDDAAADMLIVSENNITIKTALDNQHLELDDITGVDIASDIGLSLMADDGVDSSSLSLTPTGHEFTGSFANTEISPAQITANQNNYDPGPGVWFNLTSDASRNITGWVPQLANGDEITAYNGGSFDIVFTHNDTGNSTAANCFSVPGGASFTLDAGKSVTWKYSASQSRWRLVSTTV